jgi:hypothetical protein
MKGLLFATIIATIAGLVAAAGPIQPIATKHVAVPMHKIPTPEVDVDDEVVPSVDVVEPVSIGSALPICKTSATYTINDTAGNYGKLSPFFLHFIIHLLYALLKFVCVFFRL